MNTRNTIKILSLLLLAIILVDVASAQIYVQVTGTKQGKLKGGSTIKGHEGDSIAYGFSHEVKAPKDTATGLPTGKRQHQVLTITKSLDSATPQLYSALVTNENLKTVVITFTRPSGTGTGAEEVYYKITLTNAQIADIKTELPSVNGAPAGTPSDSVSFTYQKIEWNYVPGATMAADDWSSPVA